MKSKQYLYNIFYIHSSQFLILMAQKSEEIMPNPDAIIRLRRDRPLGANLTGCDVKFCWMIQIQKKCQAVWSVPPRPCVERNHQYVYGRKVVLWSDHKPLEIICKKPLAAAPKRLQRMLLRLQQYDVEIRYKPGPKVHLADTLSRVFWPTTARSPAKQETERIHAVGFLPFSEPQLPTLFRATASYPFQSHSLPRFNTRQQQVQFCSPSLK